MRIIKKIWRKIILLLFSIFTIFPTVLVAFAKAIGKEVLTDWLKSTSVWAVIITDVFLVTWGNVSTDSPYKVKLWMVLLFVWLLISCIYIFYRLWNKKLLQQKPPLR